MEDGLARCLSRKTGLHAWSFLSGRDGFDISEPLRWRAILGLDVTNTS